MLLFSLLTTFMLIRHITIVSDRNELLSIRNSINLGMSIDDVMKITKRDESSNISMSIARSKPYDNTHMVILCTPYSITGSNWILYIRIKNSSVVGVFIRIADEISCKPANSPEDLIVSGEIKPTYLDIKFSSFL